MDVRLMKSGGEAAMEESRLIQRAGEGDASAFNALMGMHERRMYAVALRMCGIGRAHV